MPEIRTVTTLKRKREEIAASIKLYEKQIAQARSDLAHVTAAIRIFEASRRFSRKLAGLAHCIRCSFTACFQRLSTNWLEALKGWGQCARQVCSPDYRSHLSRGSPPIRGCLIH
jgi:hypothetical protein